MMLDVLGILSPFLAVAYAAGIVGCFLKGRRGLGWFGVVAFTLGLVFWFPLYQHLRDIDAVDRFWMAYLVGAVPAVVVIVGAFRPALPGSRWHKRHRVQPGR